MDLNSLSFKIIGIAMQVHSAIGPGLLESAYENALSYELAESGLFVQQQYPLPFVYKGTKLDIGYRINIL